MTRLHRIRPLQTGERIVDTSGRVLPAFALLWQQLFGNGEKTNGTATSALTGLDAKADKVTKIIAGTGLNGGGDLSQDRTLNADIQELLDGISSTRGVILYRGASGWAALAPGTAGQVLTSGGAGADPHWV